MGRTTWKSAKPAAKPSSAKRRWMIAATVVALLAGGVGAAAWWRSAHPPEDPQVARVKSLQQQVFRSFETQRSSGDARSAATPPALAPHERAAAMTELREEMEKLTEEQRDEVRRSMGDGFRERMRATIKEYRALPKEKRAAFLDKQIDQMEKWRGQFQRGSGGGNRDANRGGPTSSERRLQRRREMLAGTTPEERAEAEMYFSDLNARREARGLESFGFGGRR